MNRLHDAGLHVENSGATRDVAINRKRPLRSRAERKHRVVMTDDQNFCVVATFPMHMRATCRGDNLCPLPGYFFEKSSQVFCAHLQMFNVKRR